MPRKPTGMPELKMGKQEHFQTLIFTAEYSEHDTLNKQLLEQIYQDRTDDEVGLKKSNMPALGGWHSNTDYHARKEYREVLKRILQAGHGISTSLGYHPDYVLKIDAMWSIINPPGSGNAAHIHPDSLWSGVYYVHTPEDCGPIMFTDPRTENHMRVPRYADDKKRPPSARPNIKYIPRAGLMVMFPSWLYHSVEPNMSQKTGREADRVIISFNMTQTSLASLRK